MITFLRPFLLIPVSCLLSALAVGQIKDNDISRMNESLRGKDYEIQKADLQRNSNISMSPKKMERWDNRAGMFDRKTSPLEMRPSWEKHNERISYETLSFPMKEYQHLNMLDKRSTLPNLDQMREIVMVSKYNQANVHELPDLLTNYTEMVDNISMQDLNRFQYRRNHSTEPGLPVQRAGSSESVNTPRSSSGTVRESGMPKGFNLRPASSGFADPQAASPDNRRQKKAAPMVQSDSSNPVDQVRYGEKTITVREK